MLKCSLQRHDLAINRSLEVNSHKFIFSPALTEYNLLTMVRKSELFSGEGGGQYSIQFLPFYIPFFYGKGTPFIYLLLTKLMTLLSHT